MSPRETKAEKALRLISEHRLELVTVGDTAWPGWIHARCKGDDGAVYDLGYDPRTKAYRCNCVARGECSHILALKLVTVRPT